MIIGIDISQMAYENTGVANYLESLIKSLFAKDDKNEYILFFSSLRRTIHFSSDLIGTQSNHKVSIKQFKIPPFFLDILWNKLHIFPIEWFIGNVDIFISSDWTEPPTRKAKKVTILYDFIIFKHPEETHNITEFKVKKLILSPNIVAIQKRKLLWMKKECKLIICISESTKRDAIEMLGIEEKRLKVIYPGV